MAVAETLQPQKHTFVLISTNCPPLVLPLKAPYMRPVQLSNEAPNTRGGGAAARLQLTAAHWTLDWSNLLLLEPS